MQDFSDKHREKGTANAVLKKWLITVEQLDAQFPLSAPLRSSAERLNWQSSAVHPVPVAARRSKPLVWLRLMENLHKTPLRE